MHRYSRAGIASGIALITSLAAAPAALAGDVECRGTLTGAVAGNVIVPDEAACTLSGTVIDGSITVKSRATLDAQGIETTGGIQAESPLHILVRQSQIGNNLSVAKAGEPVLRQPEDSRVELLGNSIKGDIALKESESTMDIAGNTTGGSIQVEKNRGPIDISGNMIGNQISCQDNAPPPTGSGNSARQYGGQCPAPLFGTTRP
jgi:hypothetical protein